jgi:N-acetylneuraminic acid mutarotase
MFIKEAVLGLLADRVEIRQFVSPVMTCSEQKMLSKPRMKKEISQRFRAVPPRLQSHLPRIPVTLALAALLLSLAVGQPAKAASWITVSPMGTARSDYTATLLTNGQVLVAGGNSSSGGALSSVELFDPTTQTWKNSGSMRFARRYHTATLLPNGKVLVAAGVGTSGYLSSWELYDPNIGQWTANGSMTKTRGYHTATLLANGQVLVAGGAGPDPSAELYNPTNGTWTATGSLNYGRIWHTATLLTNGQVLVAAGRTGSGITNIAELYNPTNGTWRVVSSLNTRRESHTATLLPNGKVLVAGGGTSPAAYLFSSELYDPTNGPDGAWTINYTMTTPREYHTATLLSDGKVLIAGGYGYSGYLTNAELYTPTNNTWKSTNSMNLAREYHCATLLRDGRVLIAGGVNSSGKLTGAELYATAIAFSLHNPTQLPGGAFQFTFTNLPDAGFLVYGTTNLSVPFSNWTVITGLTEISPGQYQFTDSKATNKTRYFYRVRSP